MIQTIKLLIYLEIVYDSVLNKRNIKVAKKAILGWREIKFIHGLSYLAWSEQEDDQCTNKNCICLCGGHEEEVYQIQL